MSKKTINVEEVKKFVNTFLANNTFSQEEKKGMVEVLHVILRSTGNFNGYTFLNMEEMGNQMKVTSGTEYSRLYF